jgi:hypothetical protein
MKTWQSYLRDTAIQALDEGADRLGDAGTTIVHRLAKEWRGLSDDDKHELIELAVAIGGAISLAATAFREKDSKKKGKKAKKVAKKAGKKVLKKVVAKTTGVDLKKAKKK